MYSQLKKNQQQMYHHTQITPNAKTNNTYAKYKTVNQSSFGTLFLSNVLHILDFNYICISNWQTHPVYSFAKSNRSANGGGNAQGGNVSYANLLYLHNSVSRL